MTKQKIKSGELTHTIEYDVFVSEKPVLHSHDKLAPQCVRCKICPRYRCAVALAPETISVTTVEVLEVQMVATVVKVCSNLPGSE